MAGTTVEDLPLEGPDLIFVSYPAALSLMPFANLWSILFFLTYILLAIDTLVSKFCLFVDIIKVWDD